jgi:hypothetical protein
VRILLLLGLLMFLSHAMASKVYKSVDEEGNTIYSETPPHPAFVTTEVSLPPPPTAADVEKAKQDHKALEDVTKSLEKDRIKREQTRIEEEQRRLQTRSTDTRIIIVPDDRRPRRRSERRQQDTPTSGLTEPNPR